MRYRVVIALAGGLLASCMMGPDYHRPVVETPQRFLYAPQEAAATADTEWWKQFDDPVLNESIAAALANNKDVKIAAANVEQAAAVLIQTRSPLFPQVGYQGTAARVRLSQNSTTAVPGGISNPTDAYSLLAGASWELDLWGRVRRLSEAARANLLASEEARRGVILSLAAQVATTYIQLRGLDEQLAVSQRTLATYGESLRITNDKFKFGQVSKMNVAQVQSQYETAAAKIPQIRSQIVLTENALSVLLGRNPGSVPRGKSILTLTLPPVPAGVPSELLERRPDLLQAEQQLVTANAQIGAAKALYFPTISLTGALGTSSTQLHELFTGPSRVWAFAGQLSGPIFTGGAVSGQVAQATAGQKVALASYERAIQNAFADVEDTLSTREQLVEQLAAQERLVKALQEYSALARLQYDGGYSPYATVLQAEQQLFPEELNLAAVRAQLFASLVSIYRAMGGGWVNEADKLAPQPVAESGFLAPSLPSATTPQPK
ncbi:MAG TPA: efflux transporter outer membrane subunit [Chloroflexota bacterium]|nr:efflux transporter outer membrane subunit [Chloroflexota bacterium]